MRTSSEHEQNCQNHFVVNISLTVFVKINIFCKTTDNDVDLLPQISSVSEYFSKIFAPH